MSTKELHEAAQRGNRNEVARLVDEEGVEVDSEDRVSVCVLWLLILVLFGIEWNHCSHVFLWERPLERRTRAAGSRSEPYDYGPGK